MTNSTLEGWILYSNEFLCDDKQCSHTQSLREQVWGMGGGEEAIMYHGASGCMYCDTKPSQTHLQNNMFLCFYWSLFLQWLYLQWICWIHIRAKLTQPCIVTLIKLITDTKFRKVSRYIHVYLYIFSNFFKQFGNLASNPHLLTQPHTCN